jgi:ADP-dependent NAD(P)H-hydrate dehydratase / NAD(P)H-hydrate epimerase
MTGAARLAALSALRAGSGVVTIAVPTDASAIYASSLLAVMLCPVADVAEYKNMLDDRRISALLLGNGNGITERTRLMTLTALGSHRPIVLDADALTVFASHPEQLFEHVTSPVIMTPHEGEFKRLFALEGTREARAQQAAILSRSIIVLKGAHTVIASPDGRCAINNNAPPWLATAGSGDVLAGIIAGLLAQAVDPFYAACMGVWLHGEAATLLGRGMIADDLPFAVGRAVSQFSK